MNKKSILIMSVLAAFALGAPATGFAAKKSAATADSTADAKAVPYHGKVASVDAAAKTFTIKGKAKDRVFTITDKTTITKDGAAADISAITVGEEVRGQATKSGDNWEAVKVYLGAKEKGAKGAKTAEPAAPAKDGAATPAKPADAAAPAAPAAPADAAPAPAKDGASAPTKPADPAAPADAAK